MRLSEIRHQDRALSILRRALASGRTHHAYLFDGPDGVGKEATALALAARLLCLGRPDDIPGQGGLFGGTDEPADDLDACGQCESCTLLGSGNHPDFQVIHRGLHTLHPDRTIRASKGLFLVVELIRHFLIEPAVLKPTVGPRRVFLIRDAERMNEAAQNALLKTLEEPPGQAVLLLVTSSAERLLPTIRSRCQHLPFGLLPAEFVAEQVASQANLAAARAQTLARLSNGRLGAALSWHRIGLLDALDAVGPLLGRRARQDPEAFGKGLIEIAEALAVRMLAQGDDDQADDESGRGSTRRAAVKQVPTATLRDALKLVFMLIGVLHRDALVTLSGAPAGLRQLAERSAALAGRVHAEQCDRALAGVVAAERMLDRNVAAPLVCERLCWELGD